MSYRIYSEVIDLVRMGYDDYDWDCIPYQFDGTTTVYVEVFANDDFSELLEIIGVEF